MSNPYASPEFASNVTAHPEEKEQLRRVAKYQQWVLYALLANICVNVGAIAANAAGFEGMANLLVIVVGLPVALLSMAAIFLLARELYNTVIAVFCAILMIVPCISLLVLLVVNGKATSHLQARGIKVGLLGANPATI